MPTPSLVKNAADVEQVNTAAQKSESRQDRDANDVREVMNSVRGRRFIWNKLAFCGLYKTSYAGEHEIFYNEGMRNIGLKILADVSEACPEAYLLMQKENREENNV